MCRAERSFMRRHLLVRRILFLFIWSDALLRLNKKKQPMYVQRGHLKAKKTFEVQTDANNNWLVDLCYLSSTDTGQAN